MMAQRSVGGFLSALFVLIPSFACAEVALAPHRAIYDMSLISARNGSDILDVKGKMQFDMRDSCDGWIVEQQFALTFTYGEGNEVYTTTKYSSWESKDGLQYNFVVQKTANGKQTETLRGDASLTGVGQGGVAHYLEPKAQDVPLAAGTLFPTAHTLGLLKAAAAGDVMFPRVIFDGSEVEGASETSALIVKPHKPKAHPALDTSLLAVEKAWPIRLAFYATDVHQAEPDYEMQVDLLENGVWDDMVLDYNDFRVRAILSKLESLPATPCP